MSSLRARPTASLLLWCLPALLWVPTLHGEERPYAEVRQEAETYCAERSWSRALTLYASVNLEGLNPDERFWVEFRLADALWRSQAATGHIDTTDISRAREALQKLVKELEKEEHEGETRGRIRVEALESLGDLHWGDYTDWGQALPHYEKALDWWAGASSVDLARERYLAIVWRMSAPSWRSVSVDNFRGDHGNQIPLRILENARDIAPDPEDGGRAELLIAGRLQWQRDVYSVKRTRRAFEAALEAGRKARWHDDALYQYAQWLEGAGSVKLAEDGSPIVRGDYPRALELYNEIRRTYEEGETRYFDSAGRRIEEITRASVTATVSKIYLPGSEIRIDLAWRNVPRIDLSLSPVDLTRDVSFTGEENPYEWLDIVSVGGQKKARSWSVETNDKGKHARGQRSIVLDQETEKLPPGAYMLEAHAGGASHRDLVLVSDVAVVVRSTTRRMIAYVCDAVDGSPVAGAKVKLWLGSGFRNQRGWRDETATSDENGLVEFDAEGEEWRQEYFIAARKDDRQAFARGSSRRYPEREWHIFAVTDRPAYRPEDTVQWKATARFRQHRTYSTPDGETLTYEIYGPRGNKVDEGEVKLNAFGSAWGELPLTATMALGQYSIRFKVPGEERRGVGVAKLFRLEEYKLPEFQVKVETPQENDKPRTFRGGESVEATVQASYYFGGPVAGARVQIVVRQRPFQYWWRRQREYPWFHEDSQNPYRRWGRGETVEEQELTTDAEGRATIRFTPLQHSDEDREYIIEARVTDASRREIIGSGSIKVTRQRYYVQLKPEHHIYAPADEVEVAVRTVDANGAAVGATGAVRVTRQTWVEIWVDPSGKEVSGSEAARRRADNPHGWRLKFRGYESEDILERTLRSNEDGQATLVFRPARDGYYRIAWEGQLEEDAVEIPPRGETTVWVATGASAEIGYRHDGVEIIVDRDTFRVGETAPVMLVADEPGRHVLFTVEFEDVYFHQVVRLDGRVKLVQVPLEELHAPNVALTATLVQRGRLHKDEKILAVPPLKNFLQVDVALDRESYEPGQEAQLTVSTRDHQGHPTAAEVSVGVVDAAVYYIEAKDSRDPREFFFGRRVRRYVSDSSTFRMKAYALLSGNVEEGLRDHLKLERQRSEDDGRGGAAGSKLLRRSGKPMALDALGSRTEGVPGIAFDTGESDEEASGQDGAAAVVVRSDFRATAFWQSDIVTGEDGTARVKVQLPESPTRWHATAHAATRGNRFGTASAETRTRLPLLVRLQAPRFFVKGDVVVVSAVINNNSRETLPAEVRLDAAGLEVKDILAGNKVQDRTRSGGAKPRSVVVAAGGETRVDWVVAVTEPGTARLRVTVRGEQHADAMEKEFPVHEHGIEKFIAHSGKVLGTDVTVALELPAERERATTSLGVQVTPSLAVTMLDALPYLIDYPYGCTEQTLSRFLPAVIVRKTLLEMGLDPVDVAGRLFGGIEAQHAQKTHPDGPQHLAKLDDMITKGLARLYDFQRSDGGWGWWKNGQSDHFMSAYVVWGLSLAHEAGIGVEAAALRRGVRFLDKELVEAELDPDVQAWMLHALAVQGAGAGRDPSEFQEKAFANLWEKRDRLGAYTRALFTLAAHHTGRTAEAQTLARNLENGVLIDDSRDTSIVQRGPQSSHEAVMKTARWGSDGVNWRWSEGGVEATAFALRALLAVDPQNKLIEPAMNWLVKNRRGSQWKNTRDTAIVILSLNDYLRQSGELKGGIEYTLEVNGETVTRQTITAANVLTAPSRFEIPAEDLRDGENSVRLIRNAGTNPLYFAARATYFSHEEPIPAAGSEIFVRRQYYKLVARKTLLKGVAYDRVPLADGDAVTSGERVEVVLHVETKNHAEYLVFEDLKPAGLEAVQIRSGHPLYARELNAGAVAHKFEREGAPSGTVRRDQFTGRRRRVHHELRDRKVALFIDKLPQGTWEMRYEMRAEVPGRFHALPVVGHAMYVPEIRCNGAEIRFEVEDSERGPLAVK